MSGELRAFLAVGAALVLLLVIRKIRRSQFDAADSLYWLGLSAGLLVVAVFPQIAYFFSGLLGFQSPSNFVFLVMIALLLAREFSLQAQLAALRRKVTALVQEVAVREADGADGMERRRQGAPGSQAPRGTRE